MSESSVKFICFVDKYGVVITYLLMIRVLSSIRSVKFSVILHTA